MTAKRPGPSLLPPLAASLTLGLAPFSPQPHVLEKLRMVAAGAAGMAAVDWFDLAMHGAPWVWLVVALASRWHRTRAGLRHSTSMEQP